MDKKSFDILVIASSLFFGLLIISTANSSQGSLAAVVIILIGVAWAMVVQSLNPELKSSGS